MVAVAPLAGVDDLVNKCLVPNCKTWNMSGVDIFGLDDDGKINIASVSGGPIRSLAAGSTVSR